MLMKTLGYDKHPPMGLFENVYISIKWNYC